MQRKAILFQVASGKDKIKKITSLAFSSFDHKIKLIFRVGDRKAAQYLDDLLWSYPVHTFLPHQIATSPCEEMICITDINCNPNGAKHLCNLTNEAVLDDEYSLIYDFDDHSNSDKKFLSDTKMKKYKEAKLAIASF